MSEISTILVDGVNVNKANLRTYMAGREKTFVSGKKFSILTGGADMSTPLANALASGENIELDRGVIGYSGAAGLAFTLAGQTMRGAGTTTVATSPTRGTVLKRLSGTGVGFSVPIYLEGIEIENLCFDQNSLGGSALLFKGHKGRLRNLVFHNQGGTAFALRMSGVNLSQVENIWGSGANYGLLHVEADAVALYGAYYTTFRNVRSGDATTSDAIRINASSALDFFGTFVESPIYITGGNVDIRFFGLHAEVGARKVMKIDGLTGGSSDILVKGGKVYAFENATSAEQFFNIANATGVSIEDVSFTDNFSPAGRGYIRLENATGFAARNLTARNGTANAHWLLDQTGARSDQVTVDNCRVIGGDVRLDMHMSGRIANSNLATTFAATSQLITGDNIQANVNAANTSGLLLIGCANVTDTGRVATRYGYGGAIGRLQSVASAAELNLDGVDSSEITVTVSGTTTITSIKATSSIPGRRVTLLFEGVLTFTDGSNLKLAGNFVTSADDSITLVCNPSGNWIEVARSAN